MLRARPVTFPQRPLEEGKSLEAPQSVQDRFRGVSPRSDSKFPFRQGRGFTAPPGPKMLIFDPSRQGGERLATGSLRSRSQARY